MKILFTLLIMSLGINALAEGNMSHTHMKHVYEGWKTTPNGAGFLPTALEEANIALTHATIALKKDTDLSWLQLHATHVAQALSGQNKGPGLGFGMVPAAMGVAKHIELAAKSPGASANVKTHAEHVSTSANNAVYWGEQGLSLITEITNSTHADKAKALTIELRNLMQAAINGMDSNGDGTINWTKMEGGLMEADKHLGFMIKGESL